MRRANDPSCFEPIYEEEPVSSSRHVLVLTESVRRILALHNCARWSGKEVCSFDEESGVLTHCGGDRSSQWTLMGTAEGFPPRRR